MAKSTLRSNITSPSIDTDLDVVGSVYSDESDEIEIAGGAVIGESVVSGTVSQYILSKDDLSTDIIFRPSPTEFPGVGNPKSLYIAESTDGIYRWDGVLHKYFLIGKQDAISWRIITSDLPVTLAGYGIIDAAPSSHIGSGGSNHATATALSDGFMSKMDKIKLEAIEDGAEANVNADWMASTGDAKIFNKPTTLSALGVTDIYTKLEVNGLIQAAGGGDMMKIIYATNSKATDGYVDKAIVADNASTVNGLSIETAVPRDALFITSDERAKLNGIEIGAEVNNISDIDAINLTNSLDSILHYHSADRDRANHTGTQAAATILEDTDHNFVTALEKAAILHNNKTVIDALSDSNGTLMYNSSKVSESPINLTLTALALGPYTIQYNEVSTKLEITHTA
jgi:hypothetical protein